jgi:superfamily I DNA/RNA helicase
MTEFKPTAEQEAIVSAATSTDDNLLVQALAGAAKTSTLVLIAQALKKQSMIFLAFNKSIAEEAATRMPSLCNCSTLNSAGHRAWGQQIGKRLHLNKGKLHDVLSTEINAQNDKNKAVLFEVMSELNAACRAARTYGWVPDGHYSNAKPVLSDDEFWPTLDFNYTALEQRVIKNVVLTLIKQSFEGIIDFDDQIYMPAIFTCRLPKYPIVLVDEAQDLSELNHRLISKMVKKRIIAVGDSRQAIYGFRGALSSSMEVLKKEFNMKEFELTISFRCAQEIVKEARWRAPQMQYADWAIEGKVDFYGPEWEFDDLPDACAILCRNNAPLITLAMALLKAGRPCEYIGNDIQANLTRLMKKLGKGDTPTKYIIEDVMPDWWRERRKKLKSKNRAQDEYDCIMAFLQNGDTLKEALRNMAKFFSSAGSIKLMTGHKSKGLEFDEVFFLDKNLLDVEGDGQDDNLMYVMQTRAKSSLIYISSPERQPSDMTDLSSMEADMAMAEAAGLALSEEAIAMGLSEEDLRSSDPYAKP